MMRLVASPVRRLLAAACLAWLAAGAAIAQDPRASAAQAAARDWLTLTDRGDAPASWNAASGKFRAALPLSGWADALSKKRGPMGAIRSRTALKTSFQKTFPGVPQGDYAQVSYNTSFSNNANGHESVTLERERDGKWRVVGYFVH
jgi:hypothetical protein